MRKVILLTVICVGLSTFLSAQSRSEFQIGVSTPSGDFADDEEDEFLTDGSGIAGTGVYVGYKLLNPLKADGLFTTFSIGVMYNGLQTDFKDEWEDEMEDDMELKLPSYVNIPVLVGLQYEKSLSTGLSLFGEAGIGANVLQITKFTLSDDSNESKTTFKPSFALGYKFGGGIVLNNKYSLGLTYLGLGSHKVKYEESFESDEDGSDSEDGKFEKALPISSLNITLGIRF